ncbi:MAG: hypothetical protein IKB00_05225 [Bacteroidaceae bacterium]|nr:hypothetical protein [Bacteroidaceae bacterium]
MKRLLSIIIIAFLAIPIFAQNTLTIHQKDGQQFSYGFEEKPVVTFTDNDLIIKSSKTEVQYEMAKVAKFTFDDVEDAVIGIKANDTKSSLSLDEYTVCISGAKADVEVRLIASDGKQIQTYKTNQDGSVSFSIAELPEGTYIISTESLTVKILKK